jgi:arylsulfatase A-like enzyme
MQQLLTVFVWFTFLAACIFSPGCGSADSECLSDKHRGATGEEELLGPETEPELEPPPRLPIPARKPGQDDSPAPSLSRPNVVLIVIDALRADKLGSYGCRHATSPSLDSLAATGVQFDRVLAQCSWTRPSMGSLLTSRYPRSLGLYREEDDILDDRFEQLAEILRAQGYTTIGMTANPVINSSYNFHQGFDEYIDSDVVFEWMEVPDGGTVHGEKCLPSAANLFDEALRRIDARGQDAGPFYLQINIMEVHEWAANRPNTNLLRPEYGELFPDVPDSPFVKYLRMVRQATDQLGAFVGCLTTLPGWEDTLFVILSDHGEGLNDHPGVQISEFHGRLLYDATLDVPWIMFRKGWTPKQAKVKAEVRLLDVLPTLLDYLGLPIPAGLDGVSVLPLVNETSARVPLPEMMVAETYFRGAEKIAVYGRKWKYINSRRPQPGVAAYELQARGLGRENGTLSNQFRKQPQAAQALRSYLGLWEKKHPRARPAKRTAALSEDAKKQLGAIGYLH